MARSRSSDHPDVAGMAVQELVADAKHSRTTLKRIAAAIETSPDVNQIKTAIVVDARALGIDLASDAERWPAKRLLRLAAGRAAASRKRRNPITRDEEFECLSCGAAVPKGGVPVRDHCHRCLVSLHVDNVPGDRAAQCGGIMHPVGLGRSNGADTIEYQCATCGAAHRVIAHPDDDTAALQSVGGLPPL
ncbi:MAG: RNHCP domain-containing protein [Acidobacteria bacterium]|nr:RNHCP domain-containing protein [Acidobacteriota bacterium]